MSTPTTDPPARRWYITALGVEFAMMPIAGVGVAFCVTTARVFGVPFSLELVAGFIVGAGIIFASWALASLRRGEALPEGGMWARGDGDA